MHVRAAVEEEVFDGVQGDGVKLFEDAQSESLRDRRADPVEDPPIDERADVEQ